jgi:predicted RNA-binding protein with PIN domain
MALIIDGYNLLYASGILGGGRGPGFLERSRQALLNFLAESLDEKSVSRCQVVFDASIEKAPRGLPRRLTHRGITVHFASGLPSADELIEQLILAESAPRQLTVVSSDHRLQRAAKRRKATAVDSDVWFYQTLRDRAARRDAGIGDDLKPDAPTSAFEVNFWLQQFGTATEGSSAKPPETEQDPSSLENPFPPGYGEDVLDEEI